MDRRLQERRRRVAEERARSNLSRLVRLLTLLGVVAVLVWFAQSPFMSVGEIAVRGADQVEVEPVLSAHDVAEGRPLLLLDTGGAEAALEDDPWVAEASVARDWPTRVVVEIEERVPVAVVELAEGGWLASADGVLLEPNEEGISGFPTVALPDLGEDEADDSLELEGAVAYAAALPERYRTGSRVEMTDEGLEAMVGGHLVRVGRPFDVEEKARVTAAMLDSGVEEDAILTVVAPASPAILPPGASVPEEGEEEGTTTTMPTNTANQP